MKKLPKKCAEILFVVIVTILMTAVVSFGILYYHLGWRQDFFKIWFGDFLLGCGLSLVAAFLIIPLIKKGIDKITKE